MLVAGRNCWRIERAGRLAFLIDGASYYAAARAAVARAQRSVFLLGWDFDSRIRLVPQGAKDGFPEELGEFLMEVVRRRRELRMYILSWDFAMVFALDREWVPLYKLGWRTQPHARLSFRLDDRHPPGGSHHQKVLVVDDAVAFVGGLDLTHGRWDTPAHRREEPNRLDAQGRISRPNHDVQAIVDGAAARALGELCRDRWLRATRKRIPMDGNVLADPWPQGLAPDIAEIDVAISRTDPGWTTGKPVEEIRHLYVDAIAAARRSMYLENQYFSSSVVGAALEERLQADEGPDVVVVSRLTEEGWLEERTMGVLRARLHRRLRAADRHNRYRLLYPHIPGLEAPDLLNVHSKVLVVDDELASVGSANFNNRSMGFDTECNIAIEARGEERVRRVIAGLRDRLLAEHLGTAPQAVADAIERAGGRLAAAVDALRRPGERTLEPMDPTVPSELDLLVPASAIVDPERPTSPELLVLEFVPPDLRRSMAGRVARFAAGLLILAAAAQWLPLGALADTARDLPPAAVLALYVVAGLLVVPVTLLIVVTAILYGPLEGGLYAFAGALLNAAAGYVVGRALGRDAVRRLAGLRLNAITRRLAGSSLLAVAVLRLLPVAPFSIVNAVAGASRVRLRDYVFGTALGMAPGILLITTFVDRVRAAATNPGSVTYALLAADAALIVAAAVFVWRRFGVR